MDTLHHQSLCRQVSQIWVGALIRAELSTRPTSCLDDCRAVTGLQWAEKNMVITCYNMLQLRSSLSFFLAISHSSVFFVISGHFLGGLFISGPYFGW